MWGVRGAVRDGDVDGHAECFRRGVGGGFNIDLGIGNLVFLEETFGFAAITAPWSGIDQHMHFVIITGNSWVERNVTADPSSYNRPGRAKCFYPVAHFR